MKISAECALRSLEHLIFRNPKSSLRDGDRKAVNLNAVEIFNGNLNRIIGQSDKRAQLFQNFIFQFAEAEISFSQEVAGAASGVKKFQRGDFILQGEQGGGAIFNLLTLGKLEVVAQIVKEQRVNHFANIFFGGVKHAACALAIFLAESRFKHCAENRRANLVPAEIFPRIERADTGGRVADGSIIRGEIYLFVEQPAVDVREIFQRVAQICAGIGRRIQHIKKILERGVALVVVKTLQVVKKLIGVEKLGVAGIKAEDQPRTNFIKVVLVVGDFIFLVIFGEGVANFRYNCESLAGNFFLGRLVVGGRVDKKLQTLKLIAQVAQFDNAWLVASCFINSELGKVASDNPARLFFHRLGITHCLFKGRQKFSVGLLNFI